MNFHWFCDYRSSFYKLTFQTYNLNPVLLHVIRLERWESRLTYRNMLVRKEFSFKTEIVLPNMFKNDVNTLVQTETIESDLTKRNNEMSYLIVKRV